MKPKLTLFLLLLAGCFQNGHAYQSINWEFVNSFSDYLTNVYTQGTDTVYVVGQNGLIAQSPNRGKNWNYQHITANTLNDIYFISNNVGFIVGSNGTILKTTNAGASWIPVISGTTQKLNAIAGTGIDNIWAVGDNGVVIKSNDIGQSWNTVSITNQTPNFSNIGFKNDKGYIVGNIGSIYQTLDNGDSWVQQINIEEYTGQEEFCCLSITENKVFLRSSFSNFIYVNANSIWEKNNIIDGNGTASGFCFITDSIWYYTISFVTTGDNNAYLSVFKTMDGGNSWTLDGGGKGEYIQYGGMEGDGTSNLAFAGSSFGYLVSGNYLYRTPYVGDIIADIPRLYQDVCLIQTGSSLDINYTFKTISNVKITSTSGQTVFQQNEINKNEISINTSTFTKGIYISQITLKDNTQISVKWIKR